MRYTIYILLSCILLNIPCVQAQVSTQNNFVYKTIVNTAGVTTQAQVDGLPPEKSNKTVSYFDGLGRPVQSIVIKGASDKKDIITPVEYDVYGRIIKKILPYSDITGTTYGSFRADAYAGQVNFYSPSNMTITDIAKDARPYEQSLLEFSPLNRVVEKGAAGQPWQPGEHVIKSIDAVNTTTDGVKKWTISSTSGALPVAASYPAGDLYKNTTIDEQGKQLIEFKDKEGKLILKKSQLTNSPQDPHTDWLCTYYVYDDFNNLRFVIPPKAVATLSGSWSFTGLTDVVNELCFIYEYDERSRLIRKKIPGAAFNEMVYDLRDRLVFSQDGNLKVKNQWLATFYDSQNRVMMTALYNNTASRSTLQTSLNNSRGTTSIPFTFPGVADLVIANYDGDNRYEATSSVTLTSGFDTGTGAETEILINPAANNGNTSITATNTLATIDPNALTPLTYTFYDDYNFTGALPLEQADLSKPNAGSSITAEPSSTNSSMTKGMITGTKTLVLGSKQYLTSTIYYDDKGRQIQVVSENLNNGKDVTSHLYDFEGKILSTFQRQRNPRSATTPETKLLTVINYDHAGHLISVAKQINETGTLKVIAQNRYNALGQLITKTLGDNLDSLKYDYNIRGWQLGANRNYVKTNTGNFFGYELGYDQPNSIVTGTSYNTPQFNGNISGTIWRSQSDQINRKYDFAYDNVNRLTGADFNQQNTGTTTWTKNQVDFSVSGLSYDQNGNIQFMNQ
ncbi:DUF6443 domain-containing protein, partial [Chitinophaga sp.]|uniref:DUF6443 domain-containing protein n=1 Tax=Chitinophaga sp. TaxID=1869181 RepID=UPI002F93AA30